MDSVKCAYLSQRDALVPMLSVKENVQLVSPDCDVEGLLGAFGLLQYKNRQAKALSGGMARRAAFARALSAESELLLLDEPFTGLDIPTKNDLQSALGPLLAQKSVILVTHDTDLALRMCDRVIVIKDGRIALDKPSILSDPNEIIASM